MTKTEFMAQLRRLLRPLPPDEIDGALSYYEEYLDDAEDEGAAIAALGSPKEVAGIIVAELASGPSDLDGKSPDGKRGRGLGGLRATWVMVLAGFASPVLLPLAIVAVVVVVALLVVLLAMLLVSGVLLGVGVGYLVLCLVVMVQDFIVGLVMLGSSLVMLGVGWLMLMALAWLWRVSFDWLARRVGKLVLNRRKKA